VVGLDNPIHIALILLVVLMVFGAKRLPEMGRSLGSGLRGFKESISGQDTREQLPAATVPVTAERSASPAAENTPAL